MKTHPPLRSAFTLIELLVVVAIIAILAAISIGPIKNSIARAGAVQSLNAMKQIGTASMTWSMDNNNLFPYANVGNQPGFERAIAGILGIDTNKFVKDQRPPGLFADKGGSVLVGANPWDAASDFTLNRFLYGNSAQGFPPRSRVAIQKPASVWYLATCQSQNGSKPGYGFGFGSDYNFTTWRRTYDGRLVGAIFCDGHAELVPPTFFSSKPGGKLPWNPDAVD